ncbi:hypothetical protein SASPL_100367 [Salvia splendens]|uniref:Hexosyltransferase n=1 Tax=Salvia splendens TaxID=180675 RepID=A0A8X9ABI4_SALSN|nr:hypothetical protein SASPL_100367 [Salvia splendens]
MALSLLPLLGLLSTILLPYAAAAAVPSFREAPAFCNGAACSSHVVHVMMPLDTNYIRGTMAAVLSVLQHSTCPENVTFHFLSVHLNVEISSLINSTFPFHAFKMYRFDPGRVSGKISKSVRHALDQPLNYARIYMADILPASVKRVIYLDSDIIVVDDISKLWGVDLEGKVLAAPEYCHANFTSYFTEAFWSDRMLAGVFEGKRACYFNTGVMVVDVERWRRGGYRRKVEEWMEVQKHKRIYHLGSLPPILLVFAGNIKGVEHRWNQHGLGGFTRGQSVCCIGAAWLRLDSRRPCSVDYLWAPYDLYRSSRVALEE